MRSVTGSVVLETQGRADLDYYPSLPVEQYRHFVYAQGMYA